MYGERVVSQGLPAPVEVAVGRTRVLAGEWRGTKRGRLLGPMTVGARPR